MDKNTAKMVRYQQAVTLGIEAHDFDAVTYSNGKGDWRQAEDALIERIRGAMLGHTSGEPYPEMLIRQMISAGPIHADEVNTILRTRHRMKSTPIELPPKGTPGRRRTKHVNRALIKQRRKQKHRSK